MEKRPWWAEIDPFSIAIGIFVIGAALALVVKMFRDVFK